MKIIHLADTHLGYSAYRKVNSEGINQRELDIYYSFQHSIDKIIALKPDLVLHAGDLFDSVRPTNRAITVALEQMIRLSEEQIPVVIIAGNHETPRLKETGHIFKIFDHLKNIYPIYNNAYELLPFKIKQKKVFIHVIPQCQSKQDFEELLKKVIPDKNADVNIFMAHGAVAEIKAFKMNEFNELIIPVKALHNDFDYIALGHYHSYTEVLPNVFYAGSTERLSFTEASDKKGFITLDIREKVHQNFIEVQTRPMIDFQPIDCTNLNPEMITKKIYETVSKTDPKEKILRIKLANIPVHIYHGLDISSIRDLCKGSIHFEIKTEVIKQEENRIRENTKIESLASEFQKYLRTIDISEKDRIKKIGLEYIHTIETADEQK